MSAFADYIVPVALEVMGIFEYTPDLSARIAGGVLIERDSDEEIEIRAHTLYATALADGCDQRAAGHPTCNSSFHRSTSGCGRSYHATFRPAPSHQDGHVLTWLLRRTGPGRLSHPAARFPEPDRSCGSA